MTYSAAAARTAAVCSVDAERPYRDFVVYQDGTPFMIVNATFAHVSRLIAGFSRDHQWMVAPRG